MKMSTNNPISKLRIASRKSDLARIQAYQVGAALRSAWPGLEVDFQFRESLGDINQHDPLWQMPEKGVFTQDFVEDLRNEACDMVVHSWKDLPLGTQPGLEIVATLPRADARDLLLFKRNFEDQVRAKRSLRVLSSSPRRAYNLSPFFKRALPLQIDAVEFITVRGNVPTRVRKLMDDAQADALIVAKAALDRLLQATAPEFSVMKLELRERLKDLRIVVLPLKENPTAAAQGALAVEIKSSRSEIRELLSRIHCQRTFDDVQEERRILGSYGGGCHQKIGVSVRTRPYGKVLSLRGLSDSGEVLQQYKLRQEKPASLRPAESYWPSDKSESQWFSRASLSVKIPEDRALWIAKSDALPEGRYSNPLVWTSGSETWFKLARRGVWVNGSNESLGEELNPELETLFGDLPWLKLSHASAPTDRMPTLATYQLVPKEPAPNMNGHTDYFWMSSSAFERALELNPEIRRARHACGPGNSARRIRELLGTGGQLQIFLSYEDWKITVAKKP